MDIDLEVNLGSAADTAAKAVVQTMVPAPVSFRGMPAPRFWEFEDARIDWGLIDAGPGDLPHLLMADFATNYGNDWYVIPAEIEVGTLTRTRSLVVTDTFGVQILARPVDDAGIAPAASFSMFQLSRVQAPPRRRLRRTPVLSRAHGGEDPGGRRVGKCCRCATRSPTGLGGRTRGPGPSNSA